MTVTKLHARNVVLIVWDSRQPTRGGAESVGSTTFTTAIGPRKAELPGNAPWANVLR